MEHLYSLEKEMATHSSILAWVVRGTFKLPGKLLLQILAMRTVGSQMGRKPVSQSSSGCPVCCLWVSRLFWENIVFRWVVLEL